MIQLTVSEDDDGKTPARCYSYVELLDLQSRLMLVAGQAEHRKENVDRFITVSTRLPSMASPSVVFCGFFLCASPSVNTGRSRGEVKGHGWGMEINFRGRYFIWQCMNGIRKESEICVHAATNKSQFVRILFSLGCGSQPGDDDETRLPHLSRS